MAQTAVTMGQREWFLGKLSGHNSILVQGPAGEMQAQTTGCQQAREQAGHRWGSLLPALAVVP